MYTATEQDIKRSIECGMLDIVSRSQSFEEMADRVSSMVRHYTNLDFCRIYAVYTPRNTLELLLCFSPTSVTQLTILVTNPIIRQTAKGIPSNPIMFGMPKESPETVIRKDAFLDDIAAYDRAMKGI